MNRLLEYFQSNTKYQIHKWMHYFDIYERHFSRFRNTKVTIVEIGVFDGGSLQMWKDYFGPEAVIHGIDIAPRALNMKEDQIHIHLGSQSDRQFLQKFVKEVPQIDILIDDGGHTMEQQIVSFEELYPYVSENGVYLCEDLHTSYWASYGGGYRNPNSFIEYSKDFVDKINAYHSNEIAVDSFTQSTRSLHYYDSVLVIEKGKITRPQSATTGTKKL